MSKLLAAFFAAGILSAVEPQFNPPQYILVDEFVSVDDDSIVADISDDELANLEDGLVVDSSDDEAEEN